ncbi:MAG: nucleotide exchange factor GrpE, partial [Spirochaetes bacterium]|nr:nucleotide exchange factor GrpE [Spirochaetota bacterium]
MAGEERNFDDTGADTETEPTLGEENATVQESAAGAGESGGGSAAADASDSDDEVAQLRARVQELEHENSELKDQYLRKQADFENFRK